MTNSSLSKQKKILEIMVIIINNWGENANTVWYKIKFLGFF